MKTFVAALLAIAGGTALAYLYAASGSYYPVLRISSPDGLTYTALLDETADRGACAAANERFLAPLTSQCKECKLVFGRCESKADALDLFLHRGEGVRQHLVVSSGMRIALMGPEDTVKAACELIVADLRKRGVRPSSCVTPTHSAAKS